MVAPHVDVDPFAAGGAPSTTRSRAGDARGRTDRARRRPGRRTGLGHHRGRAGPRGAGGSAGGQGPGVRPGRLGPPDAPAWSQTAPEQPSLTTVDGPAHAGCVARTSRCSPPADARATGRGWSPTARELLGALAAPPSSRST